MEKSKKTDMAFIASMNDDLLQNILLRLPAKPFAFASCVNRSWNIVCNRILSRPKMVSAFSRNPHQFEAVEEAIDKALSEPIRPDFVIANITCGNMEDTLSLITKRVGTRVPVIVSIVAGVLGKEVCNDKAGEVKQNDQGMHICPSFAILLTIGYLPGIKVDVIPVIQSKEETEAMIGDKFVMDIRNFVSEVSDHAEPACLMLFGLGNPLWEADPYIGVIKRRKYSVGLDQKPKIMASLVFHQVTGADEQYLTVKGDGIKTGDHFQVYIPDLTVAEASLSDVSSQLRNIMSKLNKQEVIGGFLFAGRYA
uniref:F-box domain-containing protein n=1 Tax=Brassica campestris TaxID=3711 RepID=M4EK99_BRACM